MPSFESQPTAAAAEKESITNIRRVGDFVRKAALSGIMAAGGWLAQETIREEMAFHKKGAPVISQSQEEKYNKEELASNRKYQMLLKTFGTYFGFPLDKDVIKRKKEGKQDLAVSPLVGDDGVMDSMDVLSYLETFPKGWAVEEFSTIACTNGNFVSENEGNNDVYGLPKSFATMASATDKQRQAKGEITIYRPSHQRPLKRVLDTIGHELGHGNDWENDSDLSFADRVEMLYEVNERLSAGDRYYSSYVESIENKDSKLKQYVKAREYWAEICMVYFSHPEKLSAKDFLLVERYVKKNDSSFDENRRNETLKERSAIYLKTTSKPDKEKPKETSPSAKIKSVQPVQSPEGDGWRPAGQRKK